MPIYVRACLPASLPTFLLLCCCPPSNARTVPSEYTKKTWAQVLTRHPTMTLDPDVCNKPLFAPSSSTRVEADRNCSLGERVYLQVMIHNPLQIPITIKNLHLGCMHGPLLHCHSTYTNHTAVGHMTRDLCSWSIYSCIQQETETEIERKRNRARYFSFLTTATTTQNTPPYTSCRIQGRHRQKQPGQGTGCNRGLRCRLREHQS